MTDRHVFAIYVASLKPYFTHDENRVIVSDADIYARITRVLRLQAGDQCILFDHQASLILRIHDYRSLPKQVLSADIVKRQLHQPLKPSITLIQAITKKPAFESIVYAAAQMGVTSLIPCVSEKVHAVSVSAHDIQRWQRIMIAACEQSKQFVLPTLAPISSLAQQILAIQSSGIPTTRLVFDGDGKHFIDYLPQLLQEAPQSLCVAVGPEGGFSAAEIRMLYEAGFQSMRLGCSVLRSEDAVLVGLGCLRSLLR